MSLSTERLARASARRRWKLLERWHRYLASRLGRLPDLQVAQKAESA